MVKHLVSGLKRLDLGSRCARGVVLAIATTMMLIVIPAGPASAKSHHYCGSRIIFPLGETGDLKCLGETKDPFVGDLMGSLPTCGDTGTRSVQVGLRGVYQITMEQKYATTYGGRNAWRYRWDYVIDPSRRAGYRYCKR